MTSDIAEFLISRRAKVTPEEVGLPAYGKRRVCGLGWTATLDEAATAGVSVSDHAEGR